MDDILIHAPDYQTLHKRLNLVLDIYQNIKLTISKTKLQIGDTISFAGHTISKDCIFPDKNMLKAIKEFKRRSNKTELRVFLGLAIQLARFIPDLAHCATNLRKMTSTKMAFTWQDPHEAGFILTKKLLTSPLVVKTFNTKAHTILLTDASRLHKLGFVLMHF